MVHQQVERMLLAKAHEEVDKAHGQLRALAQLCNLGWVVLVGAKDEPAARQCTARSAWSV